MASAIRRPAGWQLSFRWIHQLGGGRRLKYLPDTTITLDKRAADTLARNIDDACRALEIPPLDHAALQRLDRWQILTPEEHHALTAALPLAQRRDDPRDIPILDAFHSHLATQREQITQPSDYQRHRAAIVQFTTDTGIHRVRDITLPSLTAWIATLRDAGDQWDTRRHRLIGIRRACAVAPSHGLPDILNGVKIDRKPPTRAPIRAFTWNDLVALLQAAHDDTPAWLAITLMGCCGLRPSELTRLTCADAAGGILRIGVTQRKNATSRRDIPLPQIIADRINPLVRRSPQGEGGSSAEAPLLPGPGGNHLDRWQLADLIRPHVAAIGSDLTPKTLRKTFASLGYRVWKIDRHDLEAYMGHRATGVADITADHYLSDYLVEELRPTADRINAVLRAALRPSAGARVITLHANQ